MTRKRFVKLCMGIGYSRNAANLLAIMARQSGQTYAVRWERERKKYLGRRFLTGWLEGVKGLPDHPSVKKFAAAVANAAAAVKILAEKAELVIQNIKDIYDVSLVPAGGVPLDYGQNCDGLRTNVVLVDELATSGPVLTNEQIMATAAKWPSAHPVLHDHGYIYGVDMANGPDMTAYMPIIRADAVIIDPTDSRYIMRQKTATELADEIAEKLQPQGGGGHD